MKSSFTSLFLCFTSHPLHKLTINGTVTDVNGMPIEGANIYLEGTYDGGTSNAEGDFSFKTEETGTQNLIVSFLSL